MAALVCEVLGKKMVSLFIYTLKLGLSDQIAFHSQLCHFVAIGAGEGHTSELHIPNLENLAIHRAPSF